MNIFKTGSNLYSKFINIPVEYHKEVFNNINEPVMVCPNHLDDGDGWVIYSLLSKKAHVRTLCMAECWEQNCKDNLIGNINRQILKEADFQPIHRRKEELAKTLADLKQSLIYLKDNAAKILLMFPDGEYVNYEHFSDPEYVKNMPKGAFMLSKMSHRKIIPVFIEPKKLMKKSMVIYGNIIDPQNYRNREELRAAWVKEELRLIEEGKEIAQRDFHRNLNPYQVSNHVYRYYDGTEGVDPDVDIAMKK